MVTGETAELPPLTATVLFERIRATFCRLTDVRKGGNNQRYTLKDAALSAFAVFFTQSPSFLDYQRRMQKERGRNNASALFGVHRIPSDQQTRNLLDPVPPEQLAPLLMGTVDGLYRLGELETHRALAGGFLVALDGTEYFSSQAICCPNCSTRALASGKTQYHHVAVTPVLVAPGQAAVFPLPPAFVAPQDGHTKQDCELAASARWLPQWAPRIAPWGITCLGDDLYCHQPFCQQVLAQGCHFLFVCLPQSHATLYEWLADFERNGAVPTLVTTRWTGTQRLTDTYRYCQRLPLRERDDALYVDWCELTTTDAAGRVLYRNAWATSHTVTAENVVARGCGRPQPLEDRERKQQYSQDQGLPLRTQLRPWPPTPVSGAGDPDSPRLPGAHRARPARTNATAPYAPSCPRARRSSNTCERSFSISPSTPGISCSISCSTACDPLRARPGGGQTRGRVKFGIAASKPRPARYTMF